MKAFLLVTTLCLGAWAQPAGPEMTGHIQLRLLPALAKDIDAYPRVVPNAAVNAELAQRLNAQLDKQDAAMRKERAECLAGARESKMGSDYSRSIAVTMRGPRFLSITAEDSYFCGGAHPDEGMAALLLDLKTGAPIDWASLLPGAKKLDDKDVLAHVAWPVLRRLEAQQTDEEDCKDLYRARGDDFIVWLDGDAGALMAESGDVPHVQAACIVDLTLDVATLRKLGVKAELLDALTAALNDPSPLAAERRAKRRHAR